MGIDSGYAFIGNNRWAPGDGKWAPFHGRIDELRVSNVVREFEKPITAKIDFYPETLNLDSEGNWVTAYIELPEGYSVKDIDISSILLNAKVPAEGRLYQIDDYDSDNIEDLMVKFDREKVQSILSPGDSVEIKLTGFVECTPFEGYDYIRVID